MDMRTHVRGGAPPGDAPNLFAARQRTELSPNTITRVTETARIYLHVPQANPAAQRALQEFRRCQPLHLWVDDGLVDGAPRFWVSYEPPFDEQEARARTREILEQIEADGIELAGIHVAD